MAPYTHWKQTVFYTAEPLSLYKGEAIEGTITSSPNDKNPRDVDIKIEYSHKGAATQGQTVTHAQLYFLR